MLVWFVFFFFPMKWFVTKKQKNKNQHHLGIESMGWLCLGNSGWFGWVGFFSQPH
jgi:hypothetical protein